MSKAKPKIMKLLLTPAGKKGAWKDKGDNGESWESNLSFSFKGGWADLSVDLTFSGAEEQVNRMQEYLKALTPKHKIGIRLYPSSQKTLDEFTPTEEEE